MWLVKAAIRHKGYDSKIYYMKLLLPSMFVILFLKYRKFTKIRARYIKINSTFITLYFGL